MRTVAHFLDRRAGDALLKDQLCRGVNDPRARREYDRTLERARTVFEWGPSAKPANTKAKTSK